jgi:DNA-directed RNA polymerase subunit RPC12/RpoP
MIIFDCFKCGLRYRISDQYAGKRVRCKECGEINLIHSVERERVSCGDSVANLNSFLQELSEYEKQAPILGIGV